MKSVVVKGGKICGLLLIALFLFPTFTFAQEPPPSQTAGGIAQQEKQIKEKKKLEERIRKEPAEPEEVTPDEISSEDVGKKILIKKIIVEGVTLIPEAEIQKITSQFEGKSLSLKDMQKVADLITDEYRKRNYLTSRAFIPPQTIKKATLIIRVIEGKVGEVQIEGNRYFKTRLLERKLDVEEGGYFDYSALQKSLVYINEHPDRFAKAMLVPGKEPGTTDIIIKVKDRLPIHVGFEYDNFGSRYIEKDRGSLVFEHNNLLGFDDKLYFKAQQSEAAHLMLKQLRYSFPINPTLEMGGYLLRSRLKLGREFKDVEARGKATIAGLFLSKDLIDERDFDLSFNLGFDYKHIRNYLLGVESSRDEVRLLKTGLDVDFTDPWGRNIFTLELDTGIPRMWGGLKAKDPASSRAGAGGKFLKWTGNYFRLQPGPFSSSVLWKNSFQLSGYSLVASEQFQIGGPATVRGYPPAEYSGDKGYYTSLEWSLPVYFLPKTTKLPLSKDINLYDSLRIVVFYDWATVRLNRILAGEKNRTLKGYGFGLRFNPTDKFSLRTEVGYPLGGPESSDNDSYQAWVELKWKY